MVRLAQVIGSNVAYDDSRVYAQFARSIVEKRDKKWSDIFDIMGIRVICEEESECYLVLGLIHSKFKPIAKRFKDFIAMPKSNMYRSLHTTVIGRDGVPFEVQIRTWDMHHVAEYGIAAHWKYKTGDNSGGELDKWLREIKDVLANPDPDAIAFLDTFKLNLFAHEISVFTPNGDIRTLAQGATVLDLAYKLHTELGEHCIGANVNKSARPLSYILQSGDQVEILTSNKQKPEPEWLEIAVTAKAKDAIKKYFKKSRGGLFGLLKTEDPKARIAKIHIKGEDAMGILMRILQIICDEHKINIRDLHVTSDSQFFHCQVELVVFKEKVVSQLCMKLREVQSVTAVNIVEIKH